MTPDLASYYSHISANESGGSNTAKNPVSTALGKYQFLKGTWEGLMYSHPELGLTADGRTDEAQQDRAMAAFTADNTKVLGSKGFAATPGNLYAAHFLGAEGAGRVLGLPDTTLLESVLSPEVIQTNPLLKGMSVRGFKEWTSKHSGGEAPPQTTADGSYTLDVPDEHLTSTPKGRQGALNSLLAPLITQQLSQKYDLTPIDYDPFAVQEAAVKGLSSG